MYRVLGEREKALPYSERATRLVGGFEELYYCRMLSAANLLVDIGQLDQAEQAYQTSLRYSQDKKETVLIWQNLLGLARLALHRGNASQALSYIEQIQIPPEKFPLYWWFDVHLHWNNLTRYQVYHANGDPRAERALDEAYQTLQEYAGRIEDEEMRRSFLENLPWNKEIMALWKSREGG